MIFRHLRPYFQFLTLALVLTTLTACPSGEFQTDLTPQDVCKRLPLLVPRLQEQVIQIAPGQKPFIPMQGPQGLVNDPEALTLVPKATAKYGLGGIGGVRMTSPAKSPFSASVTTNGIEFGMEPVIPPTGNVETQTIEIVISDKCNRVTTPIKFTLVSDPATRPATQEELAAQTRSAPAAVPLESSQSTSETASAVKSQTIAIVESETRHQAAPAAN